MQTTTYNELRASLRKQIVEWVFDHVSGAGNIDKATALKLVDLHHELEHCDDNLLLDASGLVCGLGVRVYNPIVLAVNHRIVRLID